MSIQIVGGSVSPSTALSLNAQTGTTYTFVLTDANNTLVTASNASAQTYTIPPNSSVAYPIGSQINIIAIGAGQVTIASDGTTVITGVGTKLAAQYAAATLICTSSNNFTLIGYLA